LINPDYCFENINFYGYIKAESGLGKTARGYLDLLKKSLTKVTAINLSCGLKEVDYPVDSNADPKAGFNLVHLNADTNSYFFSTMGSNCINTGYNIGMWVWELASFRTDWHDSFLPYNEIWVPSEFCKRSVSASSPIPVFVMPIVVNLAEHNCLNPKGYFGLGVNVYVFGYMFDCSSLIERKNPFALITAFEKIFKSNSDAVLLLKISNGDHSPVLYSKLLDIIECNKNIKLINWSLDDTQLSMFYSAIDCYVSPHRAEGFGATLAEAMLAEKPVIATNYGGCTDFLHEEHSYPVKFSLIPIDKQVGPYLKNYIWAEPDFIHLSERMVEVYENRDEASSKGVLAKIYIQNNYSADVVSKSVKRRMSEILGGTFLV
jgi:glycosyltransferase involved in cell wall biosynthesis